MSKKILRRNDELGCELSYLRGEGYKVTWPGTAGTNARAFGPRPSEANKYYHTIRDQLIKVRETRF